MIYCNLSKKTRVEKINSNQINQKQISKPSWIRSTKSDTIISYTFYNARWNDQPRDGNETLSVTLV